MKEAGLSRSSPNKKGRAALLRMERAPGNAVGVRLAVPFCTPDRGRKGYGKPTPTAPTGALEL
jgi:hypothetical protein